MKFTTALKLSLGGLVLVSQATWADIRIGISTSLTGPGASLGIPVRNAFAMWPQEMGGQKLVLQVLDDAGDPTIATKNARRFLEEKVDVIIGAANTPATIAIAQVANESGVLHLAPNPVELPAGRDPWTFRSTMDSGFFTEGLLAHMKRAGVKTVGFLGLSDAYGEVYLKSLNQQAEQAGVKVVAVERFTRADTSVAGQTLKVLAARPDAVLVVAVGGGAALPQKALAERRYKGKIYHTPASVSGDFLRLSGKDAEGALVISGPEQVPEQLPASHPGRKIAQAFVDEYETKYGAGSRTQFAAHVYDIGLVLEKIIPVALKKAQPGSPEFRQALKDALENTDGIPVTKGVLRYTPSNHWGHGPDARALLLVDKGQWKLLP